jgi:hypothetical protein
MIPQWVPLEPWVPAAAALAAFVLVRLFWRPRRRAEALPFADEREERLTLEVARRVGCAPAQALPAVRREIGYSPHQSDETLVKRAAYHYRQEQPERTCHTYEDRVRG